MAIKDLQARQGKVDLVAEVTEKGDVRTFNKFGNTGRVANAKVKDESGSITLTLWNEDIDKVAVGDKVHVINGWVSEWQGELQLSTGKFGSLEVVEKGTGTVSSGPVPKVSAPQQQKITEEQFSDDIEVEEENIDDLYDEEEM